MAASYRHSPVASGDRPRTPAASGDRPRTPATAGDRPRPRSIAAYAFVAPAALLVVVLFAALAGILLQSAVRDDGTLSLARYGAFLTDDYYLGALLRSLLMAAVCTAVCALLGFPMAYVMNRGNARLSTAITLVLAAQFFSIYVIKMYGWVLVLGNNGVINRPLLAWGVIDSPLPLINTPLGVAIGLIGSALPLMVFPISSVLQNISRRLDEAAAGLGAGPWRSLVTIILPLAAPGIVGGTILSFVFCFTAFLTPVLLGGGRFRMIGNIIYDEAIYRFNYPTAATAAVTTLVTSLIVIVSLTLVGQRLTAARVR